MSLSLLTPLSLMTLGGRRRRSRRRTTIVMLLLTIMSISFFQNLVVGSEASHHRHNIANASEILTCDEMDFSVGEAGAIKVVTLISATLSVLGSAFIIFSYLFFEDLQTFQMRLIAFLSVADLFGSLSYLFGAGHAPNQCDIGFSCTLTASMSQFFDLATFLWTTCIALNIFLVSTACSGIYVSFYL